MEILGDLGRSIVPYDPTKPDLESGTAGQLRVVSYNVYADTRCDTAEVGHTSIKNWKVRSQRLLNEIFSYNADVVLLQDADHFRDFWQPRFAERGYDAIFKQRTETKARHTEGVIIAYNRDNLQLFKTEFVELNDAKDLRNDISREVQTAVQLAQRTNDRTDAASTENE
jgi:mRNA deadenylase 3'-5' endonuclease subunit Ccr4